MELHPPFISQTRQDGTPQVQMPKGGHKVRPKHVGAELINQNFVQLVGIKYFI